MELAIKAREEGLLSLDKMIEDHKERYSYPFLQKAVQLVVDVGSADNIRSVLYNSIFASNYFGRKFLSSVIIAEGMLAIQRQEDLDYIFRFLLPSFFGMEFEANAVMVYDKYRSARAQANARKKAPPEQLL